MTFLTDQFRVMAQGPLGVTVVRADGVTVYGFVDMTDEENWRLGDGGRSQTRLDRHAVLTMATDDADLAEQDVITTTPNAAGTAVTSTWRVQDGRIIGDGIEMQFYLAAVG